MRRPRSRSLAPLGCLPAAALLAACGVPPSGVIQAGAPATGMLAETFVYFVSPTDGSLVATPRGTDGPAGVSTVVALLLDGPRAEESGRVVTRLPDLAGDATVTTGVFTVSIVLPGAAPLSRTAMRQLVCTAAAALRAAEPFAAEPTESGSAWPMSDLITVEVSGRDWKIAQDDSSCPG
ncbi:hypothetical protein [Streptomyces sp. RFCAC02]|uniref:hypothetical protein n=1 Tax=Streptomyces sp. RFCAC02 TaxID=2499143 RepID=UPI0010223B08|nr:hypothetical protein [Streptomyces sp. RFCAC02]